MRIHSNAEYSAITNAAAVAGVTFTRFSIHKSRTHKYGYEVILSGDSRRRQNGGTEYAATWDQWGVFLSNIFKIDPEAKCWAYEDARDFHHKTAIRFLNGKFPHDYHGDHKFEFNGTPYENTCTKCEATRRWN